MAQQVDILLAELLIRAAQAREEIPDFENTAADGVAGSGRFRPIRFIGGERQRHSVRWPCEEHHLHLLFGVPLGTVVQHFLKRQGRTDCVGPGDIEAMDKNHDIRVLAHDRLQIREGSLRAELDVVLLFFGDRPIDLFPIGDDVGRLSALGEVLDQSLTVPSSHGFAVRLKILGDLGFINLDGHTAEAEILDPVIAEFLAVACGAPAIVTEVATVGCIEES